MTSIIFRCDASNSIGSGHVIRCRTLARELQRGGAVVTFICRRQPGDLIKLLEQEFAVLALPEQTLAPCDGLEGRDLYGAWLGCKQEADATHCIQALAEAGITTASWLVVDHYGLDDLWETQLLAALVDGVEHPKLLVIDDLADRQHRADLLLDQNFFAAATEQRYQKLVPSQCRQLLGPHYALLGSEYAQLHHLVPPRTELRRVLVYFGGVDPHNLTSRALEALMDPALAHLAVDVVLGQQSPQQQAVARLVALRPFTQLHEQLPSLAGLIARADLAIGAGGATTWERVCLQLPSLVVAIAANQFEVAEVLEREGYIQLLGDAKHVGTEQIRLAMLAWIAHPPQLSAGCTLTDGFGTTRVALALLGLRVQINIRKAHAGDSALLLRWANDPQVRANSFTPDLIAHSDHRHWFRKGLADPNRLHLIAITTDSCPIGQIRFDRKSVNTAGGGTAEAMIDLSLDRCARGLGLAPQLVHQALREMEKRWGPGTEAVAEILTTNAASNACFTRAGFELEFASPIHFQPQPMNRLRYRPSSSQSTAGTSVG